MLMNTAARRSVDNVSSDTDYLSDSADSAGESDFCSRAGAQALKAKIEAYWLARGQTVMIALHNVGFHPAIRAARFDVRSDMVNGMPRTTGASKQAKPQTFIEDFVNSDDDLVFE